MPPARRTLLLATLLLSPCPALPANEPTLFVELQLEIGSPPDQQVPTEFISTGTGSFLIRQNAGGSGLTLFPLRGEAVATGGEEKPLWISITATMNEEGSAVSALVEALGTGHTISGLPGVPPEMFLPLKARAGEGDKVVLESEGRTVVSSPGRVLPVANRKVEFHLEDLETKLANLPVKDRNAILQQLHAVANDSGTIQFHLRLLALNHGRVQVANFDALHEWKLAQEHLANGTFDQAAEHLGRVLEALPGHMGARNALDRISAADGAVNPGVKLHGRLNFPGNAPTAEQEALWKSFNPGFVQLSNGDHTWSAPVRDGEFSLAAPPGSYQLMVAVTGFNPVIRDVDLKSTPVSLSISLR